MNAWKKVIWLFGFEYKTKNFIGLPFGDPLSSFCEVVDSVFASRMKSELISAA